jgi:hypothetical protein
MNRRLTCGSAPGGSRTPNLLIRSQRLFFSFSINETSGPVSCIT